MNTLVVRDMELESRESGNRGNRKAPINAIDGESSISLSRKNAPINPTVEINMVMVIVANSSEMPDICDREDKNIG